MITTRRHAAVATHTGRLYVAGGTDINGVVVPSFVEVFWFFVFSVEMHANQMLDTLAKFQRDHILCDVLLLAQPECETDVDEEAREVAGEPRGTWAHRAVLAAASTYFLAMFTNFNESSKRVITIKNMETATLQAIVEYIYRPTSLSVTADNAQALLSAASLLGVGGVRDAVCEFLEQALAADNALGIRTFAELHACTELAAAAASYVDTHFEHVLQADELLALAPDALATLLESLAVPAEEHVLDAVLRWTQHNPQERQQHLFELLSHVRLPLLPQEVLMERARAEPLATAESRVQRQLFEALAFHLTRPEHQAQVATGSKWCLPRQPRVAVSAPHALLVLGGRKKIIERTNNVFSYELPSGRWQQSAVALPEARNAAGIAVLDSLVYVVGGCNGRRLSSMVVYDVARGSWSSGPSLTTVRSLLGVTAVDGVLYAVGGWDSAGTVLRSAEKFDPREGIWRSIASMSTGRQNVGVAALHGLLYAVGGNNGNGALNTVERYDPSAARWEPVANMSERRTSVTVSVVDNVMYAAGGWNGSTTLRSVERYRADSGWEPAPSMITARRLAAVATHGGRLYVVGGLSDRQDFLSSVEVFDPTMTAWSELPTAMPEGRMEAAAVVIPWTPPAP